MANLKVLCVSLFVLAALAGGVFGATTTPNQVALLQLTESLR